MSMHTLFRRPGPMATDPRTGRVARSTIVVVEVLSYENDSRVYVVAKDLGPVRLRTRRFAAPSYMGDECGKPQAAEALATARQWAKGSNR